MELIDKYCNRILNDLIEIAQANNWIEVTVYLKSLKEDPSIVYYGLIFLSFLLAISILSKFGAFKLIHRRMVMIMVRFSPDTITLHEQIEDYFEDLNPSAHTYHHLHNAFRKEGFSIGKHYHKNQAKVSNIATYYKNGICGAICSEHGRNWFEIVAFFQDGTGVTVTSNKTYAVSFPPPNHKFISIESQASVQEAYELLLQEKRGKQIAPISDSNFIQIYEQFYALVIKFLKNN